MVGSVSCFLEPSPETLDAEQQNPGSRFFLRKWMKVLGEIGGMTKQPKKNVLARQGRQSQMKAFS